VRPEREENVVFTRFGFIGEAESQLHQIQRIDEKLAEVIAQNEQLKRELMEKEILVEKLQLRLKGGVYEDEVLKSSSSF
jgi:hypothetical protein